MSRYYELKLENLISNPERELKKLCEFVSEYYEPEMAKSFSDSKGHMGRWRTEFTAKEVHAFEAEASDVLTELGYTNKDNSGCGSASRQVPYGCACRSTPHRTPWHHRIEYESLIHAESFAKGRLTRPK